ncbi:MAG: branched-chain amino acid ABC transporter permease [Chloroflexota bacterium]|nr:MAG: branched-chain amino acid ABC transporter permease [Chloroflexota bacterium]
MDSILTTLLNGISLAAVLILISLGLAIIFGLRGVINLAHGEFFMLGAYTVWYTENVGLPPFWMGFILAPVVTGLLGWLIERGFIRFLYHRPIETLLGTWGISIVLRELIRIVIGPEHRYATQPIVGQLQMFGFSYPLYRIAIILFTLVVVGLVGYLFTRTDFGLRVQATISDRAMAEALGINASRIDQAVFVLGAGLAGLAGAVMSPVIAINPNMGLDYFAQTFLVVIIGGLGQLLGVVGGGVLIGMLEAGFSAFLKPIVAQVIVLALAVIAIRLRPQGLFGKAP